MHNRNFQFMILPLFSATWEVEGKTWKFLTKCSALIKTTTTKLLQFISIQKFHKLTSHKLINVWCLRDQCIFQILQSMKFHTHVRYEFYHHSLSVGYKTEFAFDHLPDVDSPNGGAVWSTISQVMGSSPILA